MRRALLALALGSMLSSLAAGLDVLPVLQPDAAFEESIGSVLGYTLDTALSRFGQPREVFPLRGSEGWADMVVFYWSEDHYYLFWWDNRVWQVRFDRRYTEALMGISMGMTRQQVENLWGRPAWEGGQSWYYRLTERTWPRQIRLVFDQDRLVDFYYYRADF